MDHNTLTVEEDKEKRKRMGATSAEDEREGELNGGSVVTRRDIQSMSEAEQNRFMDAIDKMMENKGQKAGTSEFYRLAGYHGYPNPIFCSHGVETCQLFF